MVHFEQHDGKQLKYILIDIEVEAIACTFVAVNFFSHRNGI
jgi:hypothetical protein